MMETGKTPFTDPEILKGTLPKAATGIAGLDEITGGGLPRGRPTLVSGNTGSGKTLFGLEFLVRGATLFDEPGVFISFEETVEELTDNVRSLGFDLTKLRAEKKLSIDAIRLESAENVETGEFDLDGLFIRLEHAVRAIGAKRVVLDTIEALFAGISNERIVLSELHRLFRWLKEYEGNGDRGLTTVVTGAPGVPGMDGLTRLGLEEYIADCVIALDQRVNEQIGTRRLRVKKYRGSPHGTNEYPFLIAKDGFSVLPITSVLLQNEAPREKVSTGVPELDRMLGGEGYYRGSSILVSGGPGSGKSSMAAAFVDASCRRKERCLLFSYEESENQIVRNMETIGIDLNRWVSEGLLQIHAVRSSLYGLEKHLLNVRDLVEEFRPSMIAIDPVTSYAITPNAWEIKPFLTRLGDYLKTRKITTLFTGLVPGGGNDASSQLAISSLMDAWVVLRNMETQDGCTRFISVFKARGLAHSKLTREFLLSSHGINIGEALKSNQPLLSMKGNP